MKKTKFCQYQYGTDRQSWYKRNIDARSRNHCCSGKAIGITYSECVTVALVTPACQAHAPHYIVTCGLSGSARFPPLSHKRQGCREKFVERLSATVGWKNSHSGKNSARYSQKRAYVFMSSSRHSCQILMELGYSR